MNFHVKLAISIQAIAIATIILNIPLARPIIGFIYVSFLPGFLIAKILKLNFQSVLEELPFYVGLSIAFSMFFRATS